MKNLDWRVIAKTGAIVVGLIAIHRTYVRYSKKPTDEAIKASVK